MPTLVKVCLCRELAGYEWVIRFNYLDNLLPCERTDVWVGRSDLLGKHHTGSHGAPHGHDDLLPLLHLIVSFLLCRKHGAAYAIRCMSRSVHQDC